MTTTTTNWETVRHEGEVYKVLNDHAGTLTVTEWREQLEEYAEHICDKTGLELLGGTAPPCIPGQQIDKAALHLHDLGGPGRRPQAAVLSRVPPRVFGAVLAAQRALSPV